MVEASLENSRKRVPGSPHCRSAAAVLATADSEPELATEADVTKDVVERAHLFDRPLRCCPTCESDQLEPVVEKSTQDVHFMCRTCGLYWHVELGFVHRVAPSPE